MAVSETRKRFVLWRKRECRVPTLQGCLLFLLLFLAVMIFVGRQLHSFLAVNHPVQGGVIVVEGWAPDYAMKEVVTEFKTRHYDKLYVIGGPLEVGTSFAEYKTYAERGAAILCAFGLSTNEVQAVPAKKVRQDRTYTAAVTFAKYLKENHANVQKVHLFSEGPHSRRSRLLLMKALGPKITVGVTAVPVDDYDPVHWWRSSAGVRNVIGELLAYGYARFIFSSSDGAG